MSPRSVRPRTWILAVVLSVLCGLHSLPAAAQTASSTLIGSTRDGSGTPLPGVTVNATNQETGLVRSSVTGSDGAFRLPALPVGVYTVTAEPRRLRHRHR